MPRGRSSPNAPKSWHRAKAERRVLSPDEQWAADIAAAVLESCHPKQRAFAEDPHRRVSAVVGRGGGKTTGWKARAIRKLTRVTRARLVYIALSKPHAEELLWEPLKYSAEQLAPVAGWVVGKDIRFNESKLRLTVDRTGSTLQLFGADKWDEIEKLRGRPFHEVALDEAASLDDRLVAALIDRIVGPRLGDYKGAFVMFGSPGHVLSGRFYEATCPGGIVDGARRNVAYAERTKPEFTSWLGWSSHAWDLYSDDPDTQRALEIPQLRSMRDEGLITKAENQWSDDNPIWLREYRGQWVADNTTMIFQYRPTLTGEEAAKRGVASGCTWNVWDPPRGHGGIQGFAHLPDGPDGKPRTDWLFGYGFDMGHGDPFALQILAFSPSDPTRTILHVYEFERTQMYARLIAQLLIGEDEDSPTGCSPPSAPSGLFGVTGWPVATAADLTHLGGAVLDELAKVYGVRIAAAEQAKGQRHATVELWNGDLYDGRLKILKGSQLERQMQSLQWEPNEFGQLRWPKGKPDHAADAAMYVRRAIAKLFQDGKVAAQPQRQPTQYSDPMGLDDDELGGADEFSALLQEDDFGQSEWG